MGPAHQPDRHSAAWHEGPCWLRLAPPGWSERPALRQRTGPPRSRSWPAPAAAQRTVYARFAAARGPAQDAFARACGRGVVDCVCAAQAERSAARPRTHSRARPHRRDDVMYEAERWPAEELFRQLGLVYQRVVRGLQDLLRCGPKALHVWCVWMCSCAVTVLIVCVPRACVDLPCKQRVRRR